jgi:hypothetical protein
MDLQKQKSGKNSSQFHLLPYLMPGKRKAKQQGQNFSPVKVPLDRPLKQLKAGGKQLLQRLNQSERDDTHRAFTTIYRVVNKIHEPVDPVGSEEHSITGNITAGSFAKLANILKNELPSEYCLNSKSVYLDIGR